MSRRAGLGRLEAVLLFVLLGGGWLLAATAVNGLRRAGAPTKCANTLRQLGLAAIQYADDQRFFPHVGPLKELDGGVDSNATTKIVRSLVWYGYHDNPEGFVCPQSYDLYVPITDDVVKANLRLWFWGGAQRGDLDASPFVDGLADPVLDDTDELSFGWTRRGMNSNVRSTAQLAADRAQAVPDPESTRPGLQGNHGEGANVLQADGTVTWYAAGEHGVTSRHDFESLAHDDGSPRLTAGDLAIHPPVLAPETSWPGQPFVGRARPGAWLPLLGLFGPPALLGLLLAAVSRRRPSEVAKSGAPAPAAKGPSRVTSLTPADGALQDRQRCPLCHDVVVADDHLSRCLDCRAVFHAACVAPGGACTTLGCSAPP